MILCCYILFYSLCIDNNNNKLMINSTTITTAGNSNIRGNNFIYNQTDEIHINLSKMLKLYSNQEKKLFQATKGEDSCHINLAQTEDEWFSNYNLSNMHQCGNFHQYKKEYIEGRYRGSTMCKGTPICFKYVNKSKSQMYFLSNAQQPSSVYFDHKLVDTSDCLVKDNGYDKLDIRKSLLHLYANGSPILHPEQPSPRHSWDDSIGNGYNGNDDNGNNDNDNNNNSDNNDNDNDNNDNNNNDGKDLEPWMYLSGKNGFLNNIIINKKGNIIYDERPTLIIPQNNYGPNIYHTSGMLNNAWQWLESLSSYGVQGSISQIALIGSKKQLGEWGHKFMQHSIPENKHVYHLYDSLRKKKHKNKMFLPNPQRDMFCYTNPVIVDMGWTLLQYVNKTELKYETPPIFNRHAHVMKERVWRRVGLSRQIDTILSSKSGSTSSSSSSSSSSNNDKPNMKANSKVTASKVDSSSSSSSGDKNSNNSNNNNKKKKLNHNSSGNELTLEELDHTILHASSSYVLKSVPRELVYIQRKKPDDYITNQSHGNHIRIFDDASEAWIQTLLHDIAKEMNTTLNIVSFDGNITFSDQVSSMHRGGVFVSIHGANLVNTIFAPSGSALVEITPYHFTDALHYIQGGYTNLWYTQYMVQTIGSKGEHPKISSGYFGNVQDCIQTEGNGCRKWYRDQVITLSKQDVLNIGDKIRKAYTFIDQQEDGIYVQSD